MFFGSAFLNYDRVFSLLVTAEGSHVLERDIGLVFL